MKTFAAYIASVLLAVGLITATVNVATAGTVYLPCYPNCGPVCVPGGTMKC